MPEAQQAPAERRPTRTQKRIAEALADPSVPTITAAAKRAGISLRHAYRVTENVTVQREVARLRASQGDTARALRIKALSRAHAAVEDETDAGRLSQIAVNAATVEEKVGAVEEDKTPPRAVGLALARRLLLAYAAGYSVASARQPERDILAGVSARIEDLDAEIASYLSAVSRP